MNKFQEVCDLRDSLEDKENSGQFIKFTKKKKDELKWAFVILINTKSIHNLEEIEYLAYSIEF